MKKTLIILLAAVILTGLCGCNPVYPYEKNKCWYCKELDMALDYRESTYGQASPYTADHRKITWNGETVTVSVHYFNAAYALTLFPVGDTRPGKNGEDTIEVDWKYDKGNIIWEITKDDLFDGDMTGKVFVFELVEQPQ